MNQFRSLRFLLALTVMAGTVSCTSTVYEQRADAMKSHTKAFYQYLEAGQVEAAVTENQRIEGVAKELEQRILSRKNQLGANQIDREWIQVIGAKEAAAENWLSLGQYLTRTKDFERAKGVYRRILATYPESTFRPYRERAQLALKDLDMILAPTP